MKCLLLLSLCLLPSFASEPLRVAVLADDPGDVRLAEAVFHHTPPEITRVSVPDLQGDIATRLSRLTSQSDVDALLVLGVQAARQVLTSEEVPGKPVILGFVHDPGLLGIAHDDLGRSGKPGVGFVSLGDRLTRDWRLFQELISLPQRHLTVILDQRLSQDPAIQTRLKATAQSLDLTVDFIGMGEDVEACLAALPSTTAGVYLGPLNHLDQEKREALFDGLSQGGKPSFSMLGLGDVKAGVFAGSLDNPEQRLAVRLADHLAALARGEQAEDLPTWLPLREQPSVNGQTAARLGIRPDIELRARVDILHEDALHQGESITLKDAITRALGANQDLAARRQEVASADYDRKIAVSALLPQVSASANYQRGDADNPQIAAGISAETQSVFSLSAQQKLFDQNALTQTRVARESLSEAQQRLRATELETVKRVADVYLNLLATEALLNIELENLKLTRGNLSTARARLQVGAGGPEEVYRWESQEAQQLGSVYGAEADVRALRVSLARVLGDDTGKPYPARAMTFDRSNTLFLDPRWNDLIKKDDGTLESHLLQLARERSPDLASSASRSLIAKMRVGESKRAFYLPTLSLSANYQDVLDQQFTTDTSFFPRGEQGTWSLSLSSGIPLFQGGRRFHQLGKARAQLRQSQYQQLSAEQQVDERFRQAFAAVRASYPNIELSALAADRAGRNLEIVLRKYEQGTASMLDLLEAQDQDHRLRGQAAIAFYTHLVNLFELQRSLAFYDLLLPPNERNSWLNQLSSPPQGASR